MKDAKDHATADLLETKNKAQRFREKQAAAGLRQYAFWLSEEDAAAVKKYIAKRRKA